jgi:hypothetical protein
MHRYVRVRPCRGDEVMAVDRVGDGHHRRLAGSRFDRPTAPAFSEPLRQGGLEIRTGGRASQGGNPQAGSKRVQSGGDTRSVLRHKLQPLKSLRSWARSNRQIGQSESSRWRVQRMSFDWSSGPAGHPICRFVVSPRLKSLSSMMLVRLANRNVLPDWTDLSCSRTAREGKVVGVDPQAVLRSGESSPGPPPLQGLPDRRDGGRLFHGSRRRRRERRENAGVGARR